MSNSILIRGAWNPSNRQLLETLPAQLLCQSCSGVIQDSESKIQPGNPFILCPCSKAMSAPRCVPPVHQCAYVCLSKKLCYYFFSPRWRRPDALLRASLRWRGGSTRLPLSLTDRPTATHTLQERTFVCTWRHACTHSHTRAHVHTYINTYCEKMSRPVYPNHLNTEHLVLKARFQCKWMKSV